MNESAVHETPAAPSEAAAAWRIVGGAVVGGLGGMAAGGVLFASLVMALFGGLGGAVVGMIAAARGVE
jgi:predicted lipid-binding transport protein (Tim44 family)